MDKVGSFINIKQHDFYFNGCSSCDGDCCNGAKGFALSPLILEDFEEVYKNFAIVFSIHNNKINAFVVLNDGKSHCRYYIDNKCSIYEQRTPACKLYPISPYFEHILIDTECPSINNEFGSIISKGGKLNDDFFTQRLENFNEKVTKSFEFYDALDEKDSFEFIGSILDMPILKYIKPSQNRYIQMHLKSLEHLNIV